MTVSQFKKWLESRIQYLQDFPDEARNESDLMEIQDLQEEAYRLAVELRLPEATKVLGKPGPVTVRLLEAIRALPEPSVGPTDTMSVKQVANELGVSKETVYRLCNDGTMPHTRIGNRITITLAQLEEYQRQAVR